MYRPFRLHRFVWEMSHPSVHTELHNTGWRDARRKKQKEIQFHDTI